MIVAAQTSPTLMVNDEAPLAVSAFSYVATGSTTSELKVTSDGFLLCANVGPGIPTSSKKLTPGRARWTLPLAVDIQTMGYNGGTLSVNKPANAASVESTLACTVRTADGTANPFGPYGEVVFRDGFVPTRDRLYGNMVNWLPDAAFNGWSPNGDSVLPGVPTDPCTFDLNVDTPMVVEASVCAAATGVRPSGKAYGARAATMWTAMSGGKFVYLARIDARLGPQSGPPNGNFPPPPPVVNAPAASSVDVAIRDAYDSNYLGATASYCFLRALPASGTLNANVCADAAALAPPSSANGTIQERIGLDAAQFKATSRYLAVVRDVIPGSPPAVNAPVAAVAVFASPDVVRHETGNAFTGDDVVFGFPSAIVFDWMH